MRSVISENKGFIEKTKEKKVYIYGAGVYGRTLLFFMKEQCISEIEGFVVTDNSRDKQILYRSVCSVAEYSAFADDNYRLIIGVSDIYKDDVIRSIEYNGINDILILSDAYWSYVIENTSFLDVNPINNIAILMYHRVNDDIDDLWKLNISREVFERQISYISNHYEVLKLEEDWTDRVDPQKKYVIITFDDGYVDNYRNALPILEKYKVPATFFVPTNLMGSNEMFWWDELEELLIKDKYSGLFQFNGNKTLIESKEDRERVCREVRNRLKNMRPDEIEKNMDKIRASFHKSKKETTRLRCINTEEVKCLSDSEYASVGGHTKSHLSMGSNQPYELMNEEVGESLQILRTITNNEITTFAFPFGGEGDYCALAEEILKENGIKKAVVVKPGNIRADSGGYNLPRHMMFHDDNIELKLNMIWGIYG